MIPQNIGSLEADSKQRLASAHTRYQTVSALDPYEALQPLGDKITIAHNGQFDYEKLTELARQKDVRTEGTDSQIAARLIESEAERHGHIEPAMFDLLPQFEGAFSLSVLTPDAVYAVRDRHAMRPLVLGEREDEAVIIASEKGALDATEAEFIKEIEPGTYVSINRSGESRERTWSEADKAICLFEKTYLSKPQNIIEGQKVSDYRFLVGGELAKVDPVPADLVVPVLGSAKYYAKGYSVASGVAYEDKALAKNPNRPNSDSDRTFIGLTQEERKQAVREKFLIDPKLIKDKDIILIDDSLVRGTTMKVIIQMLREAGAGSVHVRIGSDKYVDTCRYGVNVQDKDELLATGKTTEEMKDIIGADSLAFTPLAAMRDKALSSGDKNENYCDGCMGGEYPAKNRLLELAAS